MRSESNLHHSLTPYFLMTPTPKIAALLATYIGAAWIGEQLDTIVKLKQKDKTVSLIVSINLLVNNIKKIWF